MQPPKVFISYSHDSELHKEWVREFAADLRNKGIDVILDQWDLRPGAHIVEFMRRGIASSDRVILICSDSYVEKADGQQGGVGYEGLIITAELVEQIATRKFIPIIRNSETKSIPGYLGKRFYLDFTNDEDYDSQLDALVKDILEVEPEKPPVGDNPFSGEAPEMVEPRDATSGGRTDTGRSILDGEWYQEQHARAAARMDEIERRARMELRFGLHHSISKSQIELLHAVRNSEIRTFGWPIAVMLEGQEKYRPKPFIDGIRTEVSIAEDPNIARGTYDYWALRTNGDFYLLKSLFEDERSEEEIFFNTRIVRVAESLMFASNLYHNLGVPEKERVSIRVGHFGFAGRSLTSSSFNRLLTGGVASEDVSEVEIAESIKSLRDELPELVERILAPLFLLFDFTDIASSVYSDIVERFLRGEVS